jgi:hypothetical protein
MPVDGRLGGRVGGPTIVLEQEETGLIGVEGFKIPFKGWSLPLPESELRRLWPLEPGLEREDCARTSSQAFEATERGRRGFNTFCECIIFCCRSANRKRWSSKAGSGADVAAGPVLLNEGRRDIGGSAWEVGTVRLAELALREWRDRGERELGVVGPPEEAHGWEEQEEPE